MQLERAPIGLLAFSPYRLEICGKLVDDLVGLLHREPAAERVEHRGRCRFAVSRLSSPLAFITVR
jgi:hypothetical protein